MTRQGAANYYLKPLSLGIIAYLAGGILTTWATGTASFSHGRSDFRAYYTAGYMVRKGMVRDLYNYDLVLRFQNELASREELAMPFIHPAFESLLFVPFSFLSFHTAYFVYLALNVCVLAAVFLLLRRRFTHIQAVYRWLPAAMFLTFFPVTACLIQGQDSIILLFLLTVAFLALEERKEWRAGLCLGLGVFRFQIMLPVALLFLLWRRWRVIGGFLLSGAAAAMASIEMIGGVAPYAKALARLNIALNSPEALWERGAWIFRMPNLEGLAFGLWGGSPWNLALTAVASLALVLIASRSTRYHLLIAIVAGELVSYYSYVYDMSILLLPIVLLMDMSIPYESLPGWRTEKLLFRTSVLAFVTPVLLQFAPEHFYFAAVGILVFFAAIVLCDRKYGDAMRLQKPCQTTDRA
jgi:hypothetical protein